MNNPVLMCFLCTASHVPGLILRYAPFAGMVKPGQKRTLLFVYAAALILNFAVYLFQELTVGTGVAFFKGNLLIFWILLTLVNGLVIREKPWEHLFAFGLVAIIIIMLLSVGAYVQEVLPFINIRTSLGIANLVMLTLSCILYLPLKKLMMSTVTPFLDYDSKNYRRDLWFVPIAMSLACFLALPFDSDIATLQQLISRLLIGVATLFVCRSTAYDYWQMREKIALSDQLRLQKRYYSALADNVAEARRSRHDFKHHVSAINAMLESGSVEELRAYMRDFQGNSAMSAMIPYTGNAAADGVLYHYMVQAQEAGIHFEVECTLTGVKLPDVELCCLLGNALDNAVTACSYGVGNRFVRVASQQENGLLILTVDNSFDGVLECRGDIFLSRKRDNQPGLGIPSMRAICEKNGGTCRFESDGQMFEASFLLKC